MKGIIMPWFLVSIAVDKSLKKKTAGRAKKFLKKKKLVKKGIQWLLIFDTWHDTKLDNVKYAYEDPKTLEAVSKDYVLEWYPLFSMVLGGRTDKAKLAKIYCLPFDRIGVIESDWTKI